MSRKSLSFVLLVAAILLIVMAAATLLPYSSNKMISDLGYYTFCPFAPWSTFTLLLLAGLAWAVRRHVDTQPA
jgi:NADH:ubiquinone oxidoreductase subunit 3 (subunit A)